MKFRYEKQVDFQNPHLPWTSRPVIRVRLAFGDRHQAVLALIDSGADITLFHISLAKTLGIDSFEREGKVFGISGEKMPVHYHRLKLQLDGLEEPVELEAGFVDSPGVGALLGQSGFSNTSGSASSAVKTRLRSAPFAWHNSTFGGAHLGGCRESIDRNSLLTERLTSPPPLLAVVLVSTDQLEVQHIPACHQTHITGPGHTLGLGGIFPIWSIVDNALIALMWADSSSHNAWPLIVEAPNCSYC